LENIDLGGGYYGIAVTIVENRISKANVRLAAYSNALTCATSSEAGFKVESGSDGLKVNL
jgi:hypothetical protein